MKPFEVSIKSTIIRDELKISADYKENPIDDSLLPIRPYMISDKISLIILGQDPTIKNEKTRSNIEYTLNLDKAGALKTYIRQICEGLDISFENIYATNIFKYFYSIPPANTMNVLQAHLSPNLELLKEELSVFPKAKIITLGQPALQLLAGENKQVREYWDYNKNTGKSNRNYTLCKAEDNLLARDFYPFPHQPSIRKEFYKGHLGEYIAFVKNKK